MRACILKVYSAMLLFDDIDLTLCLETEPSETLGRYQEGISKYSIKCETG